MSYVDALEAKIAAIKKLDADLLSIHNRKSETNPKMKGILTLDRQILLNSDTYFWTKEMYSMVRASLDTFPVDTPFSCSWLSSKRAFWHIEDSILLSKGILTQERMNVSNFAYSLEDDHNSVIIFAYSLDHNEPTPGPCIIWAAIIREGKTFNQMLEDIYYEKNIVDRISGAKLLKFFLAGNLWLNQKIIGLSRQPATCKAKRAALRRKMSHTISIVQLRRKEYINENSKPSNEIDWQYRWFVRGHWRNQPTKEGIKVIWIDPFIKGPEDKPVKEPNRIFLVNR